jgi:hypothetical protein
MEAVAYDKELKPLGAARGRGGASIPSIGVAHPSLVHVLGRGLHSFTSQLERFLWDRGCA